MVETYRLGTAQKSLRKRLKTRAFQHHFSVPKMQNICLPLIVLLFIFFKKVEKLAPVRLLPAQRSTSLVMIQDFAISKDNQGKIISLFAYYQGKLETVFHPVFFPSFFFLNAVFTVKISFLNYYYQWHNLMLLFSVPNKEMQERGKVFPWVKYFTQVGKLELQESISCNMKK